MSESKNYCIIDGYTPWQQTSPGGVIRCAGNAEQYDTGSWRAMKPIWKEDKCIQCLLCWAVCPDTSIPTEDKKRKDFDFYHCKGCGVCVDVCPVNKNKTDNVAIDFVPENK